MPTYEYECTRCGAVTEVFQSIAEPARRRLRKEDNPACACNTSVTRRVGTGAGIIFKGSGFYQTDYRSESYKKAAEADAKPADKPADTGTAKSTGKSADSAAAPAPKTPAKSATESRAARKRSDS